MSQPERGGCQTGDVPADAILPSHTFRSDASFHPRHLGLARLGQQVVVGEACATGKAKEAIASAFKAALLGVHGGEPPPAR